MPKCRVKNLQIRVDGVVLQPGELINQPKSVFEIKLNQRVYNVFHNRYGRVSSIRETSPEWVEAFVTWDGSDSEEVLSLHSPHIKFVNG